MSDPLAKLRLDGMSALVTGGSRGIGRACSELLAGSGARIAINYRSDRKSAQELTDRLKSQGAEAFHIAANVASRGEAEMLVEETVDRFGGLDILVNSAGIWNRAPIAAMSDEEWELMLGINLTGTMNTVRAAVPFMRRAGGGRIVNISSTAGQRGESLHSHYATTKGGVIAFTKSLAVELAAEGIRCNCVAPGWVETDMTRHLLESDRRDEILASIPLRRMGHPDEVAGCVLFLASGLASYVNGEVLNVNGGSVLCG